MWTSKPTEGRSRPNPTTRWLEAACLAAVFALLPELPSLGLGPLGAPHPGWIAVLVLSARYGGAGFFTGLAASAFGIAVGSAVAGEGIANAWSRLDSEANVIALGTSLIVSWIATSHARRQAELSEQLSALGRRVADADATVGTLSTTVSELRARLDRATYSISFLREVAGRLDGPDPVAAAEAAADLALIRTGASAVAITVGAGEAQQVVAFRHAGEHNTLAPPDPRSAEISLPILSGRETLGALALWGIGRAARQPATSRDLEVIASWVGSAFDTDVERREEVARLTLVAP